MKIFKIILFFLFSVFVAFLFYNSKMQDQKFYECELKGEVIDIHISTKGYHTVTLNNKQKYYLGYYRSCIDQVLKEGDFLVKERKSWVLEVRRKQNGLYIMIIKCDHK
jgi:hypothetical protein